MQFTFSLHCLSATSIKMLKTDKMGSRLSHCPTETLVENENICSHSK